MSETILSYEEWYELEDTQDENDPFYTNMPLEYTASTVDTDTENIPF